MDILVSPQTAGVLEGLGASVTGIRAFSSVLAQVILVVRTPLKGQWAIGAQEGTNSSVDTLMDLEKDRDKDVKPLWKVKSFLVYNMTEFDRSPGAERSV